MEPHLELENTKSWTLEVADLDILKSSVLPDSTDLPFFQPRASYLANLRVASTSSSTTSYIPLATLHPQTQNHEVHFGYRSACLRGIDPGVRAPRTPFRSHEVREPQAKAGSLVALGLGVRRLEIGNGIRGRDAIGATGSGHVAWQPLVCWLCGSLCSGAG